jgi:ADP-heptose:LPS heptosyltransferase
MSAPPLHPTVVYFCRLGDMVMLSSLLRLLHRRYHRPCQVIGAGSWNAFVYQGNPDVAQFWSLTRHVPFPLTSAWPSVRRALRSTDPGPIYVCERSYRQLPRIKRMLFLSGINPARCVFLTDEPASGAEHWVDCLVRFGERTPAALRATDYPMPLAAHPWAPRLQVLDTERVERDAWIYAQGWSDRQLILVQPGNHRSMSVRRERWRRLNTDDKAWPTARWAALLQKIHAGMPHALIVLRGAREEVPMLEQIQAAAGLEAVVVAGLDLRQFFALCESAHSMISVDTGPAHAAAALGLPLVVMYGGGSPRHWLPRSPSGSPVLGVGGPPVSERVDQISVDAVFDAWCTLLRQMQAPAPARQRSATMARQASGP